MLIDTNEAVPPSVEDSTTDANESDEHDEGDDNENQSPVVRPWTLDNWPFEKVDDTLREQISNEGHWDVQSLAAYTPNEDLISPVNYKNELARSVVVMSFRLKYALPWNAMANKKDKIQCTTEIVQIRVVTKISPNAQLLSPSKRNTPPKPKFDSLSKKHAH